MTIAGVMEGEASVQVAAIAISILLVGGSMCACAWTLSIFLNDAVILNLTG